MPIYEYKCRDCGNQLELMQKISEEPLRECPHCQGGLEKQWSLSGFQFKGSGWYVSDYANRGAAENKAENGADGKAESKAETASSGESKSDAEGAAAVQKTSDSGESTARSV